MDSFGFVKVAAAIPKVQVADCAFNATRIVALAEQAAQRGVELVAFPELSLTGATCGDLLLQPTLLDATEEALGELVRRTRKLPLVLIVGAPLRHGSGLYNCAVVCSQGKILGVVPQSALPDHSPRFERRIFTSGEGIVEEQIRVAGEEADFGSDLSFEVGGVAFSVEVGMDLLAPQPRTTQQALDGAKLLFHLTAIAEEAGCYTTLRDAVVAHARRSCAAVICTSAGAGESSTDLLFAGNALIAEAGQLLAEAERFSLAEQLIVADIDTELLAYKRMHQAPFRRNDSGMENTVIEMEIPDPMQSTRLDRPCSPHPFLPAEEQLHAPFCREILEIQALALAKRLTHTHTSKAVIGISGGLDSTLALLAVVHTFDKLGLDRKGILGITMPGFGTSDRTYHNALELMERLGITVREISIRAACEQHFRDLGIDPDDRSAAYENAQARERTQILMDLANKEGALVIGTGDLSELALGWATYNGDQMSMYGLNASVPKTLVRKVVEWAAVHLFDDPQLGSILLDVVATPVSPELLPADHEGKIAQKTEDLVGPYELHDFFLYHFIESGYTPRKLLYLAETAFEGVHDSATILHWLGVFFRRFFAQQFKRSAMPDGPKVGVISLSPRGGFQMPSDASARIWLHEIETLEQEL